MRTFLSKTMNLGTAATGGVALAAVSTLPAVDADHVMCPAHQTARVSDTDAVSITEVKHWDGHEGSYFFTTRAQMEKLAGAIAARTRQLDLVLVYQRAVELSNSTSNQHPDDANSAGQWFHFDPQQGNLGQEHGRDFDVRYVDHRQSVDERRRIKCWWHNGKWVCEKSGQRTPQDWSTSSFIYRQEHRAVRCWRFAISKPALWQESYEWACGDKRTGFELHDWFFPSNTDWQKEGAKVMPYSCENHALPTVWQSVDCSGIQHHTINLGCVDDRLVRDCPWFMTAVAQYSGVYKLALASYLDQASLFGSPTASCQATPQGNWVLRKDFYGCESRCNSYTCGTLSFWSPDEVHRKCNRCSTTSAKCYPGAQGWPIIMKTTAGPTGTCTPRCLRKCKAFVDDQQAYGDCHGCSETSMFEVGDTPANRAEFGKNNVTPGNRHSVQCYPGGSEFPAM